MKPQTRGWEAHNQRIDEFDATQAFRKETAQTQQEQFDAEMRFKWDTHGELLENQDASLAAQVNRDETTAGYYNNIIRLREEEMNQTDSPEEKAKIQAEIERIKAQTGLYNAQDKKRGAYHRQHLTVDNMGTIG